MSHYLSVCALYRYEAEYLREWIEFHRIVGVERFYLYNNLSDDRHREVLAPYVEDGLVSIDDWPLFPGQAQAYAHCLAEHGAETRWLAFLDVDEFLFSPERRPLPEVLAGLEEFPGIAVNRLFFGTSGHVTRPEGLVLENFVHKLVFPEMNKAIKSIVDPRRTAAVRNVHEFEYADGVAADEHGRPVEGLHTQEFTLDRLRVNHYFSKSEEEMVEKFQRPQAGGNMRGELNLNAVRRRNERFAEPDTEIQHWLPALREALRRTDERAPVA